MSVLLMSEPDFRSVRLRSAAVHESGHAVIAALLGCQVKSCVVRANGSGNTDFVRSADLSPMRRAMIFAAGAAAQRKFYAIDIAAGRKPAELERYWSPGDYQAMESAARDAHPVNEFDRAGFLWRSIAETARLVDRCWPQIKAAARQLIANGGSLPRGVNLIETAPPRKPAGPGRRELMRRSLDVLWGRGGTYP